MPRSNEIRERKRNSFGGGNLNDGVVQFSVFISQTIPNLNSLRNWQLTIQRAHKQSNESWEITRRTLITKTIYVLSTQTIIGNVHLYRQDLIETNLVGSLRFKATEKTKTHTHTHTHYRTQLTLINDDEKHVEMNRKNGIIEWNPFQ